MPNKQQPQKHVPMRTCIVTREKLPKKDLIRLVRVGNDESEFQVQVDVRNKINGRGANIKPDLAVLELGLQKHLIERALQLGRQLSEQEQEQLRNDFAVALEEKDFRTGNQKVKFKVSREEFEEKLQAK